MLRPRMGWARPLPARPRLRAMQPAATKTPTRSSPIATPIAATTVPRALSEPGDAASTPVPGGGEGPPPIGADSYRQGLLLLLLSLLARQRDVDLALAHPLALTHAPVWLVILLLLVLLIVRVLLRLLMELPLLALLRLQIQRPAQFSRTDVWTVSRPMQRVRGVHQSTRTATLAAALAATDSASIGAATHVPACDAAPCTCASTCVPRPPVHGARYDPVP